MPPEERKEKLVPGTVDLHDAVSSLVQSILSARVALDRQTAELAELYQRHEILRQFPPPAFGMQDITLRLPYAAVDVQGGQDRNLKPGSLEELPHMLVYINADMLARLPAQAVATVELRLNQETLSLLLSEKTG